MKKEAGAVKRVRILLRVSSNQQLEADGDLDVQRQLVLEYIRQHENWEFDGKEYFEGGVSGYKNSVEDRGVLQEASQDAENREYDILVAYKDDRIGRRMWEIGYYVMSLKHFGVDIYTVKDGCISPEMNDIMGQMVLALRYGNAQKSSSDTGMRVKDTARKLVAGGKFMGGRAPYGYRLENSGEVSKHGRLLKKLVVCPEEAELVKHIYKLSLHMEFGSVKIAKTLNENESYRQLAPDGKNWKGGTITSILTNPVYSGRVAYKRRERIDGRYRTLESKDWVTAREPNETIRIIEDDTWNRVQEKRALRAGKFVKRPQNQNAVVIGRNDGCLPLIDILYCGHCGRKMVNGSKYHYWTIKGTGERRASKVPIYRCQNAHQGVPHDPYQQVRADQIEGIVFERLSGYIELLQETEDISRLLMERQDAQKRCQERELAKEQKKLEKIKSGIAALNSKIPEAAAGGYALTIEELMSVIRTQERRMQEQQEKIGRMKAGIRQPPAPREGRTGTCQRLPTWRELFLNADVLQKRVLANKLIERIDLTKDTVSIRFKIDLRGFHSA